MGRQRRDEIDRRLPHAFPAQRPEVPGLPRVVARKGRARCGVLVLVRSDLLRWSLSKYCKTKGGECFEPTTRNSRSTLRTRALAQLRPPQRGERLRRRRRWRRGATRTTAAGTARRWRACRLASFVFYEDMIALGPGLYASWVLMMVRAARPLCASGSSRRLAGVRVAPHPTKYHGDDISSFVTNHAAVAQLFAGTAWAQAARGRRRRPVPRPNVLG